MIVGNSGGTNVGASFHNAAYKLRINVFFCDASKAFAAPTWIARINWRLRGHYPTFLRKFSREVVKTCERLQPRWLLSTGLAPIESDALKYIGEIGVERLNYLTDDPWNPTCSSRWFFDVLPLYDSVFSVRRANLSDLTKHGCNAVRYLPFGFDPELFYPDPPATLKEKCQFSSEVVFAGGADRDRVPYLAALIQAGFKVALYGDYWEQFPETKSYTRGHADPHTLRRAIGGAKVALGLVRRANRDGHSMRTFEVPAIGACMLVEDTEEHREIFGEEGQAVIYFRSMDQMIKKSRWLLEHEEERQRLAQMVYRLVTQGRNTYRDRLMTMLGLVGEEP